MPLQSCSSVMERLTYRGVVCICASKRMDIRTLRKKGVDTLPILCYTCMMIGKCVSTACLYVSMGRRSGTLDPCVLIKDHLRVCESLTQDYSS